MSKRIVILGSTGSVGTQALDVIRRCGYEIDGLCAMKDIDRLEEQIRQFRPSLAAVRDEKAAMELKKRIQGLPTEILAGEDGVLAVAAMPSDVTLNAIVGIAGLRPTLAALEHGRSLALANKESLVTAGDLVLDLAKSHGISIHPVDSEHSAIFQCLLAAPANRSCKKILLTASGGPFFGRSPKELRHVTVEETLQHPNWDMGAKITVDSATMMNKGLEVIEAYHLFGLPEEKIEVVIHPQSVIHSMVEFADGAVLAQLGAPDMRVPIGYALGEPDRLAFGGERLDFTRMGALTFASPDTERFPCLAYAREALRLGGSAPVVLNGANEEAVAAFLRGEAKFGQIPLIVRYALDHAELKPISCAQEVYEADARARLLARACLRHL